MPVTGCRTDSDRLALEITARHDAPPERAWELWSDPRLLERWWGPPGYPATVSDHDLSVDGRIAYAMTGPDGTVYPGWWRVLLVDAPRRLVFEDGFADATGAPDPGMPVLHVVVDVADDHAGGSITTVTTTFPDAAGMRRLLEMGTAEGMSAALGQADGLLAGVAG